MSTVRILLVLMIGFMFTHQAFAEESGVSISITGGSEAGQSCVSDKSCYDPDVVTVQRKTLVMWTNIDSTSHTVTSGIPSENETGTIFDSSQIAPGGTYSFIFMNTGTYNYFCSIHPWMTGQVIVVSNTSSPSSSVATPEFGTAAVLVFAISVF